MQRPLLCFLLAVLGFNTLQSQPLYTPRDIKEAYKNGTRSPDGRPGNQYWQNKGRYDITLTTNPPDRTIRGSESIVYTNNSPDTLKSLTFRLTVNIHRPGAVRMGATSPNYLSTGIIVDSYAENGKPANWVTPQNDNTWKQIRLAVPLLPHDSIRLNIDWHYELSL